MSASPYNRAVTLVVSTVVAAACSTFDVGEPIALVPTDELESDHVELLEDAAHCWNARFGTQMIVASSGEHIQEVSVGFSESICIYAVGRTEPNIPVEVNLCSSDNYRGARMFQGIVLHELGHVLNIRDHADDPSAVMHSGGDEIPSVLFQEEDERLLRDANPDFEPVQCPGYRINFTYWGFECHCDE